MLKTLITLGWLGDFGKLRSAAKKNFFTKCLYRLYMEKHQSYIPLYADLSDDIWFPHLTGIHIAGATHVGHGCTIYQHVTLGSNYLDGTKHPGAPTIGNNVLIGAGARIVGGVKIGDNSHIGAGCVVVDDVPANSVVVMNKPRVIIKNQVC